MWIFIWIFCFCKHLYWWYFDFISRNTRNVYIVIVKLAMCKKPYPDLIYIKPEKDVTTHEYKKYPRSLCSSQILRIQPITHADSDLSSYDMIEWPEEHKCMRLTTDTKNIIIDVGPRKVVVKILLEEVKGNWRLWRICNKT